MDENYEFCHETPKLVAKHALTTADRLEFCATHPALCRQVYAPGQFQEAADHQFERRWLHIVGDVGAAEAHLAGDTGHRPMLTIPEPEEGEQPLGIDAALHSGNRFYIADGAIQQKLDGRSLWEEGSLLLLLARQQLDTWQLRQRVTVFEFQHIGAQDRIDPLGVVLLRRPPAPRFGLDWKRLLGRLWWSRPKTCPVLWSPC